MINARINTFDSILERAWLLVEHHSGWEIDYSSSRHDDQ